MGEVRVALCGTEIAATLPAMTDISMAETAASPGTQQRSNSALWYGLLLTLLGIAAEFLYFLRPPEPIPHILPWISLLVPVIGLIYLFIGLARAFGQPAIYRGKIWGSVVIFLALLLLAANVVLFHHTRDVPKSAGAPQVGQRVPDFTLPDSSGQQTSLAQLFAASSGGAPPKALLLVFYRGYW
jgi:hypothetical protein